ncbi:hypothetical protein EON77_02820 [bacterium]|nr:MAG: hypothetical protein EON77_02820 [bacterium]
MPPVRFALLVLGAMFVGGLVGGVLGSNIVANPFAPTPDQASSTKASGGMSDLFNAPFETQHRIWRATFIAAGAALGLGFAAVTGSYALRYRAIGPAPAKT